MLTRLVGKENDITAVQALDDKVNKRAVRDRIRYSSQKKDIERSMVSLADKIQGIKFDMTANLADRLKDFYGSARWVAIGIVGLVGAGNAMMIAGFAFVVTNQNAIAADIKDIMDDLGSRIEQLEVSRQPQPSSVMFISEELTEEKLREILREEWRRQTNTDG